MPEIVAVDRTLEVFSRLKDASPPVFMADVSIAAQGWRRTIRRNGGYWDGSFTLFGTPGDLAAMFYEWLGCHFQERVGGYKTWEGLLYDMDFTVGKITRKRSLDLMYNRVGGIYIDDDGNTNDLAVAENLLSQGRYGRRDEWLSLDGYYTNSANAYRDTFLKENSWPWPRTVGAGLGQGEAKLEVTVCGYIFTANWQFEDVGDGTTDDLDDWVSEILTTDCEFLEPGSITANTLQVVKDTNQPQRCWDVLMDLIELGDASGNPYRIYCDNDRIVNYEQISTSVDYHLRGGTLYLGVGGIAEANPFMVKPGIVRDLTYPVRMTESGAWLADLRDFYIDEVEAGDTGLTLKTDLFEESEIMMAQEIYENMLDRRRKQKERGES